jgi:hypothetical protein
VALFHSEEPCHGWRWHELHVRLCCTPSYDEHEYRRGSACRILGPVDAPSVDLPASPRRLPWSLIICLPLAAASAFIPFTGIERLGAPVWLAIAAAVIAFPALPLLWQLIAERQRATRQTARALLDRFALRSLAVALLVVGVSSSNLGPRRMLENLTWFARGKNDASPARQQVAPPPTRAGAARHQHELEPFIPVDASVVVALSDVRVMQQLLPGDGTDSRKTVAAFEKCQISVERAIMLIAARDRSTRMVVLRAPGITEQRNLYCLMGFLGKDRFNLRVTSDSGPLRFEVDGLLPGTLKFEAIDAGTVVASDGAWAGPRDKNADGQAPGPLASVLERVDRGASLWSASVAQNDHGRWDLALDARFEGTHLKLRGSSIPPSGPDDRADLEMRVPAAFAAALPAGALRDGARGVVSVIAAIGSGSWSFPR